MARGNTEIARSYFTDWSSGDFDALRGLLADDVTFEGPMGTAAGVEACSQGLAMLKEIMAGINIRKMWEDGPDVITWYEMTYTSGRKVETVNWMHIIDGKIDRIRVTFDRSAVSG